MNRDRCRGLERLLVEYADGELETSERAAVEEHLKGCAECRRVLDDYRESVGRFCECGIGMHLSGCGRCCVDDT
jgi:anti-sigma factor RsiW